MTTRPLASVSLFDGGFLLIGTDLAAGAAAVGVLAGGVMLDWAKAGATDAVHRAIRKNVKARRWRRVNMVRADYCAGTLHQSYAQRQARKRAERLRAYFFLTTGVCTCNPPIPTCYHASPLCLATSPSAQGMKCHASRETTTATRTRPP